MIDSNEKIRVLIVDDEPLARRGIRQHLKAVEDVEIVGEAANGKEAVAAIERHRPDLVFLDVQMPLVDGFGVAEIVGPEKMPVTVFVTAFDEHAIRAFEINALDYLLKPFDPERFQKTLERARRQIRSSGDLEQKFSALLENLQTMRSKPEAAAFLEKIVIKERGRIFFVPVEEIVWISSDGNYVKLHLKEKAHLLRETMDRIESRLDPKMFLRLRRSTIVRIDEIKELQPLFAGEYAVVLKSGVKLVSSRRYRQNLDALLKG